MACNYDGYVIGDAILFYLDDELLSLVGRPSAHNWVQYHGETGDYDVTLERDERSAVNPTGRKALPLPGAGPDRAEGAGEGDGGPLPEIKFFNMGEITIAGHKVRALRHGMSGEPGLELFGPWEEGDEVRAAILEAGKEFGLRAGRARASTRRTRSSRAGSRRPLPAVYTGEKMKPYREWLPANGYEGTGSLGGSFYSDNIEDYYLTPYELGYGRSSSSTTTSSAARRSRRWRNPKRKKVTLAWNGEDVAARDRHDVPQGGRGRSTSTCRCPTTRRGRTTG